ncbi:hypothetical protein CRYUN_Cryun11dG0015000 [Craigia yunnanensis]
MQKDHGSSAPSTPASGGVRHRRRSNEFPVEMSRTNGNHLLANDHNKYRSMWIHACSSLWMLGGFVMIHYLGHLYVSAMVVIIQIFMARELFNLLRKAHEDKRLPGFRILNWHFYFIAMLFVYGHILSHRLVKYTCKCLWSFSVADMSKEDIKPPYFGGAANSTYEVRAGIAGENAWNKLKFSQCT